LAAITNTLDGGFVITWSAITANGSHDIVHKRYTADGREWTSLTTTEDSTLTINVADLLNNDVGFEGGQTRINSVDAVAKNAEGVIVGSVTLSADKQTITFKPNGAAGKLSAGDMESVSFNYVITDGYARTDSAKVTLTVVGVSNDEGDILVSEDFQNGLATGWSISDVATNPGGLGNFLGRFGGTNGAEGVSKAFVFGKEHAGKTVQIDFDMYEIDSWDGEAFKVFVNGSEVSSKQYWHDSYFGDTDGGQATANNLYSGWGSEEVHHYSLMAVINTNGEVKLGFGSTLDQAVVDESWGVDNIVIKAGHNWGASGLYTGTQGNDSLQATSANDSLIGDKGNDSLTGGLGADVFRWELADQGTTSSPAVDVIKDFNRGSGSYNANEGDKLDLRDLLVGESHGANDIGNLLNYLNLQQVGTNTVVNISTSGNIANGADQKVVLENVSLTDLGFNASTSQADMIQQLIQQGKLITD
jgi:hypothetical protein